MESRRYNIGLLVATITDEFSNRIAIGAMEAAKKLDANLIIFPGKYRRSSIHSINPSRTDMAIVFRIM